MGPIPILLRNQSLQFLFCFSLNREESNILPSWEAGHPIICCRLPESRYGCCCPLTAPSSPPSSEFRENFLKSLCIYVSGETETMWVWVGQRERERIPSRLHTSVQSLTRGSNPGNHEIMTWAKTKSQMLDWATQASRPPKRTRWLPMLLSALGRHLGSWLVRPWAAQQACGQPAWPR